MSVDTNPMNGGPAVHGAILKRTSEWLRSNRRSFVPPVTAILVFLLIWQAAVAALSVPEYVLPTPVAVLKSMVKDWRPFFEAGAPTVIAVVVGFIAAVAISLPLAVLMIYNRSVQNAIYPLVIGAQVIPKVALAPLFIVWFGFGQLPKVCMVVLISFFPMLISAVVGLSSPRPESLMLVRSMGASRWQAFWKIRWPWALPNIFAGAKVGITLAVVGAVVAEFIGSNSGLGVVLVDARGTLDTVTVFAAIGWLTLLGFALFIVVACLEKWMTPRGSRDEVRFNELAGGL